MRTLWLEPAVGDLAAVAIELPVILLASWFIASWLMKRFAITGRAHAALVGMLALILLWIAELALTILLGGSPAVFIQPAGLLGIAGQVLFGMFPLFLAIRNRRAR